MTAKEFILENFDIPTYKASSLKVGAIKKDFYEDFESTAKVEETEVYVFTTEKLKQLLEEYTNRIIDNVEIEVFGSMGQVEYYSVNRESITSQLPLFLKELI
jgi:hypothetical protein